MGQATPTATLSGVPLAALDGLGWTQVAGTAPASRVFPVHEEHWSAMEARMGTACLLLIQHADGREVRWDRLYPIREVPTRHPQHRAVLVADVRWWWQYEIHVRAYNIPRKTGDRRLVSGDLVPIDLAQSLDVMGYAYYSLRELGRSRRKWTALEVASDVIGLVSARLGNAWRVDGIPIEGDEQLSVENLDLAEPVGSALGRVLALIPRAAVTVEPDGAVVLYDQSDRERGEEMMQRAGWATNQGQIDRVVSLRAIRPKEIRVWFPREVEVRFDSVEELDGSSTDRADLDNPDKGMVNVLPLPDPETVIGGVRVAQGTYRPIVEVLAAWNDDLPNLGKSPAPPALTLENVRKFWFVLEQIYTALGNLSLSAAQASWSARIAALRAHYRQTWQIPEPWRRRTRDMRPYRVGVLDPFTGTKAPAQAWSQYCVEPTIKAYTLAALARDPKAQFYWQNVDAYPGYDKDPWDDDKNAAPAVVQVLDKDLGVIRIDYRQDPHGMRSQIHPSMMREGGTGKLQAPTRDLRDQAGSIVTADGHVTGAAPIGLAQDYRVAVIFTMMPAEPNDENRMHLEIVHPTDLAPGVARHFDASGGSGPPLNIAVPASALTAWLAWQKTTSARESAKSMFGFERGGVMDVEPAGYFLANRSLLRAFALSVAASHWAAFLDQREGSRAVRMNGGLRLAGPIASIEHTLAVDGRSLSTVTMPQSRRVADALALLPLWARRVILGGIPEDTGG